MTYPGLSMWNGSSKLYYFMDFWHSFCWRLWRPWMVLSTKSKGHKSNFRMSEMYRFCFYDLKVEFWWQNKCSKHHVLRLNTLYLCTKTLIQSSDWVKVANIISTNCPIHLKKCYRVAELQYYILIICQAFKMDKKHQFCHWTIDPS